VSDALQACQLDGVRPDEATGAASEQINTFLSGYRGAAIQ
jgi:multiple sugar transport system substrate-binding protein